MSDWFHNIYQKLFSAETPQPETRSAPKVKKVSWFSMMFHPILLLMDNYKPFFILSGFYSVVLTILAFAFGFAYVCVTGQGQQGFYCQTSNGVYLFYSLIRMAILGIFVTKWLQIIRDKKLKNWAQLWTLDKSCGLGLIVLFSFLVLLIIPIISFQILEARIPNPDWRIEISFFALVSLGFLVPLILTRYISCFAFLAQGEKMPTMKQIWQKTSNQQFKILLSLFIVFILITFLFGQYVISFRYQGQSNFMYFAIVSEFIFNFLSLLSVSLLGGHAQTQKQVLWGEKEDDND